ncbi:MAG TPA: hypothetical protein VLX44_02655 [Xanthobacteraceae bacterium]|nr:hypothetical protein [Xanthobacteraceae bacterium]
MDHPKTVKAMLVPLGPGTTDADKVVVHFNPASLVYTVENSTKQQSGDPKRKQFAAQFTGKLTMDLQFDTTGTGADVRNDTSKVAKFMQASANAGKNPSSGNAQAQPVLSFQWGSYEFKGTMDSFKETIDFFSADGVPLRSLVSISLARQDQVFDPGTDKSAQVGGTLGATASGAGPSLVPTGSGGSVTSAATMGGDPSAARQLAADNGLESLRATGGAALSVNAGIQLNAAAGFSASASVGAGAGLSIGGGAGLSVGAGAGLSLGAGAGAGLSVGGAGGVAFGASAGVTAASELQLSAGVGGGALFGGQASAGVAATAGAFAGLETGRATRSTTTRLDPLRMLPSTTSADVFTGENASFSLGGAATASAGFSSDVGASFDYGNLLVFDAN